METRILLAIFVCVFSASHIIENAAAYMPPIFQDVPYSFMIRFEGKLPMDVGRVTAITRDRSSVEYSIQPKEMKAAFEIDRNGNIRAVQPLKPDVYHFEVVASSIGGENKEIVIVDVSN